jgi:outer membrane protein OmpA-like peptidoglycan-associated protein
MTWKGYGESKLVNHCKNNVPCSEEEHQKNRRTEFKAVKEIKSIVKNK